MPFSNTQVDMDFGARRAMDVLFRCLCLSPCLRLFGSISAPALDVLLAPAAVPKVVGVDSSSGAILLSRIEGVKKWNVAVAASRNEGEYGAQGVAGSPV